MCVHACCESEVVIEGGSTSKGHDLASLKVKVVVTCEIPKMFTNAMKSYHGHRILISGICALEGSRLCGFK